MYDQTLRSKENKLRSDKEREMLRKMHERMRKDRQRKTNA
jgi:hypothetical protein